MITVISTPPTQQAEGPGPDGTVIKEVTDGNVTIKAVFTSAALSEFSQQ